jgi:hypothetical protein
MFAYLSPEIIVGIVTVLMSLIAPTSKGAKAGTITINDSASSKPMVIELSGTGT